MGAYYVEIPTQDDGIVGGSNPSTPGSYFNITDVRLFIGSGWNNFYGGSENDARACFVFPTTAYLPGGHNIVALYADVRLTPFDGKGGWTKVHRHGHTYGEFSAYYLTYNNLYNSDTLINSAFYVNSSGFSYIGGVESHIQYDIDNAGGNLGYWFSMQKYDTNNIDTRLASVNYAGWAGPTARVWYGYNLTNLFSGNHIRWVDYSWSSVPGADWYNVWFDGVYQGTTGGTYWAPAGDSVHSGSHTIQVQPVYSNVAGTGDKVTNAPTIAATSSSGTGTVPSIAANAVRKRIDVTKPTTYHSNNSWDYRVVNSVGTVITTVTSQTVSTYTFDLVSQPTGWYYVQARARWSDGDVSAWSANSGAIWIEPPTTTGLSASTNQNRAITATWDRMSDAASYNVTCVLRNGVADQTVSVANPGSGSQVSYTFTDVKSGTHTVRVTAVFTNGYVGTVISGSVTGQSQLPTPEGPTGAGDNPAKRQAVITAVNGIPSTFFNASSYTVAVDVSSNAASTGALDHATISALAAGTHTPLIRANWSDGDASSFRAGPSFTTTSPPPTGVQARQYNAPAETTPTIGSTGGTIPTGNYFVAVSVNAGGNRTTATVNSVTRAINESTVSQMSDAGWNVTLGQTITVSKPANCTGSDTWNVYISATNGTRNVQFRAATNLASSTSSTVISTYTAPGATTDAKQGKVDLIWVAPTGVGDNPTTYRIERSKSNPPNVSNGSPTTYTNVTSLSGGLYNSNLSFYNDNVDTAYWFYRVSAVYSNDVSIPVEIQVLA